jgi:aryl carrier-like protein
MASDTRDFDRVHAVFRRLVPITADTNFFEAGLTSAMLVETVPELRQCGLDVTLIDLFTYPTVRLLAEARATSAGRSHVPPWRRATG